MLVPNRLLAIVVIAAAAQVALLWCTNAPLGIPGEWTWARTSLDVGVWTAVLTGLVTVALYTALVWAGAWRMRRAGTIEVAAWLTALFVAGSAWLWVVIETAPGPFGLGRGAFVIYYPRTSGYFLQAREGLEEWPEFLAGYEKLLEQGDSLHLGTHPPGLAIGYGALLEACRDHPALTNVLLASRPESMRLATDVLTANETSLQPRFSAPDAACLWLASLLTLFCAVAAIWPLFGLLRLRGDRELAWRLVALWPLVPSVAVFYPKSDLLYPLFATMFAWLWMTGWERGNSRRCALAALILLAGLLLSLAFLPVAAIVALASLLKWWDDWRRFSAGPSDPMSDQLHIPHARRAWCLSGAIVVFALGIVAFRLAVGVNLLNVWRLNFVNHAGFYDEYSRTWWRWLLVNPLELAVAAGAVVTVLALSGAARGLTNPSRSPLVTSALFVWVGLWLSGKNMGEAARLWILLLPWLLVAAASGLQVGETADRNANDAARTTRRWMLLVALQAALCILTAHGIDGFHFGELLEQSGVAARSAS